MKRITALFLAIGLFVAMATGAVAQASPAQQAVSVWLEDEQLVFGEQQPFIEQGTTLVPARTMLEALGYELTWDRTTGTAVAVNGEKAISVTRNAAVGFAEDGPYLLSAETRIADGTLYAPLRFLAESAGYRVLWDAPSRSIVLVPQDSKGFMWKVEKDGTVVYLLGSIHVGNELMYPLPDHVRAAFATADYLVVEADISQPLDEEQIARIQSYMMYSDGSTLADHISEETYGKLQDILREFGLPENAFDPYKPWQVNNELTVLSSLLSGYQAGLGIDMYLLYRAAMTEKNVLELESLESQLAMFDGFSDELQESLLRATIDSFAQEDSGVAALAELWLSGDDAQLEQLTNAVQEQPEFYKALLVDRNLDMVEKIEGYLTSGNDEIYFVVAGYLHMLGEHGIVPLLEERGYTVTRQ